MSGLVPAQVRTPLLRVLGVKIGADVVLLDGTFFGSTRIAIGAGSFIGQGCYFDALDHITIGDSCSIAGRVTIITSSHEIAGPEKRAGASTHFPVVIGDGPRIPSSPRVRA